MSPGFEIWPENTTMAVRISKWQYGCVFYDQNCCKLHGYYQSAELALSNFRSTNLCLMWCFFYAADINTLQITGHYGFYWNIIIIQYIYFIDRNFRFLYSRFVEQMCKSACLRSHKCTIMLKTEKLCTVRTQL